MHRSVPLPIFRLVTLDEITVDMTYVSSQKDAQSIRERSGSHSIDRNISFPFLFLEGYRAGAFSWVAVEACTAGAPYVSHLIFLQSGALIVGAGAILAGYGIRDGVRLLHNDLQYPILHLATSKSDPSCLVVVTELAVYCYVADQGFALDWECWHPHPIERAWSDDKYIYILSIEHQRSVLDRKTGRQL